MNIRIEKITDTMNEFFNTINDEIINSNKRSKMDKNELIVDINDMKIKINDIMLKYKY